MDIERICECYYNPPRLNDIAGWNEIHMGMGTPDGSDHAMRQWAMQRMGQILLEESKRNKVAPTATLAQDATQGQPAQTSSQSAGSDPGADLEAMREDLAWALRHLDQLTQGTTCDAARGVRLLYKKWSLQ